MISINYVNNSTQEPLYFNPLLKLEREMDEIMEGVERAYNEYVNALNMYNLDATFLEKDVDEKKKTDVDEKGKNFVSQLGASVINIFKKAIAFIKDVIGKIKERFGLNKEKFSKADAICKQNPKLKSYLTDEVKSALDKGDMSITDVRALAELDRAYEEIVELSKKKDVDPESIKGKWEAAKKKFENFPKAPIIVGAVTVVGLMETYSRLTRNLNEGDTTLNHSLTDMVNFSTANKDSLDIGNKGYFRTLVDAARYRAGKYVAAANESNSVTVFIANLIDNVIKMVSGYNDKDKHDPNNQNTMYRKLKRSAINTVHQNNDRREYAANQAQQRQERQER